MDFGFVHGIVDKKEDKGKIIASFGGDTSSLLIVNELA